MGRIIGISTRGLHLREVKRQLIIEQQGQQKASIPLEDIDSLILDETAVTISGKVLLSLIQNQAGVVICDEWHLPVGLCVSFNQNRLMPARTRALLELSLPKKKQIWKKVIQAKILFQSQNLKNRSYERGLLERYSNEVRSGDPDNREAVAARLYWTHLFSDYDSEFRRSNDSRLNACLNYIYAIVRSSISRSLCAVGFIPMFGIFHSSRDNPFALADDLLELYRPFCDRWLCLLLASQSEDDPSTKDEECDILVEKPLLFPKERLLEIQMQFIRMSGENVPLMTAVERTCGSLLHVVESDWDLEVPDSCLFQDIESCG